jgi:hypothetical protein
MSAAITSCKECGSNDLSWQTHNRVDNGVQQNRLNTNDVICVFVLGCNACSETLAVVNADKVAASMNADLGTPQAALAQLYWDFTQDAEQLGYDGLPAALDALRTLEAIKRAAPVLDDPAIVEVLASLGHDAEKSQHDWNPVLQVRTTVPAIRDIVAAYLKRAAEPTTITPCGEPDWAECQRIANLPDVDEALRGFSDDPTDDNGTCVVRAVLAATGSAP